MIRHVVAFSFAESAGLPERELLLAELRQLPEHFPQMRRFALGANVSRRDSTYAYAFSAEFASEDELLSYLDSARHESFVAQRFQPLVARRAIVSFEVPG